MSCLNMRFNDAPHANSLQYYFFGNFIEFMLRRPILSGHAHSNKIKQRHTQHQTKYYLEVAI